MIDRRGLLSAAILLAAWPLRARAMSTRLSLTGSMEQGSLVVGRTEPGAKISVDGAEVSVSSDGMFAFGFEFDRTHPLELVARYADGTSETRSLTPTMRHYEIQRINGLPEAYVSPAPGVISGLFGSQRILNGEQKAPHFGVDIAAPIGTSIHAPADATVAISSDFYLEGGFTLLDHGHGVSTCYFHQSKRKVIEGVRVAKGDLIGLVGMTGRATGPHLHWGMNWFQVRLDPSRSTATPVPPTT